MQRSLMTGVLCLALFAVPAVARDYPNERVEVGYAKSLQCVACHGPDGVSDNPTVPSLAGQNAGYLLEQLEHFKHGERYSGRMTPIVEQLSDEDMDQLVAYFSRVPANGEASNEAY